MKDPPMNINKIKEALDFAAARIGCPPGDNADADIYRLIMEARREADKIEPRYTRQGPPIQMQDVLLACGELNDRERVAVQWVLDRVNALPEAPAIEAKTRTA